MSQEILINVTPQETRVALVESGVLQEVYIERSTRRGLVGNIYKGRVNRVLPGMQAAFVDIGLERAAFLHASDIFVPSNEDEGSEERKEESIRQLLREGQSVLVQVTKDPIGSKGARLTTYLSIPSRYAVLVPSLDSIGISQKIEDENERQRLKQIVVENCTEKEQSGGYIIRTAAEGVAKQAFVADIGFLRKLWSKVQKRAKAADCDSVVHEDLPLMLRALRDLMGNEVERIRVDSGESFRKIAGFAEDYIPEAVTRLEGYSSERPLFELYGVEDEIRKALERKVPLKSGGYLIIDQTEAMTTIDVNTGAFVGHRNLEETIFKTNLEAAQALARQLRLRNLGGIIIIDFIDMLEEEHKRQVMRALEKYLERDHAKSNVCEVSSLGLVEMTRKRTRESLEHVLCEPCSICEGRGSVKTVQTVCYEIFRDILRESRQFEAKAYLILASQEVVDMLLDEESTGLAELEEFIDIPIKFQVEQSYTQEQFDVVLM